MFKMKENCKIYEKSTLSSNQRLDPINDFKLEAWYLTYSYNIHRLYCLDITFKMLCILVIY